MAHTGTNDDTRRSLRSHLRFGVALIALLVGGIGGWAATTDISGAVIAGGSVVVESNVKKVQHPNGGISRTAFCAGR